MGKRQSPTPTLAQLRKLDEMSEEVKCICGSGLYNERHKDRQVPHAPNCPKYSPAPQVSCPVPDAPNVPGCQKSDNPELRKWLYHAPTCPDAKPVPQAEDGGKVGRKVCQKIPHSASGGYMHDEEHDGPYDVDGVLYCGRCHSWYNNPADHGAPALSEQPRTAAGDGDSKCNSSMCDGVQHWLGDQSFSCPNVCLCADKPGPHTHSPSGSIEAERDALRAELAAARDEIAKLRKFVSEAMHEADAEKARADKAEQRVRELEDLLVRMQTAEAWTSGPWKEASEAARAILRARQEQKEEGR